MGRIDSGSVGGSSVEVTPVRVPVSADSSFKMPARPFPRSLARSLSTLLCEFPEVLEAHLPDCFIPEVMEAPAPVLVMVVRSNADRQILMERLAGRLAALVSSDSALDVWTLGQDDPRIRSLRSARCEIHPVRIFESWWPFAH